METIINTKEKIRDISRREGVPEDHIMLCSLCNSSGTIKDRDTHKSVTCYTCKGKGWLWLHFGRCP